MLLFFGGVCDFYGQYSLQRMIDLWTSFFFLHAKRYFIQSINIKRLKNVGAIICPRNILIDIDWAQYFPGVFYLHFFKQALNPEYLNFSVEIKFEWTPWTFHLRINNLINGDVVQCSKRCIGQEKRSYSNI